MFNGNFLLTFLIFHSFNSFCIYILIKAVTANDPFHFQSTSSSVYDAEDAMQPVYLEISFN